MRACVCMRMRVRGCVHACVCVQAHACMYVHVRVCMSVCACVVCVHECARACVSFGDRVSTCIPHSPGTCYSQIFLFINTGIKRRASCMVGEHSHHRATASTPVFIF